MSEYMTDQIDTIDAMKKSILASAFRGGLGTNDPVEESALALLQQLVQEPVVTVWMTFSLKIWSTSNEKIVIH